MSELKKKRERSANFSSKEINTLVSVVEQYKNIIECKKTDVTSWKDKDTAWKNIANIFNSNTGNFRSKKTLRSKYDDIKKSIRKKVAHNKMEQFKTGGGKADIHALTPVEEIIISMLPTSIDYGGPCVWDSDKLSESCNENATCSDVLAEIDLNQIDDNTYDDSLLIEMNNPISAHDMESQIEYIDEEYLEDTKPNKEEDEEIRQNICDKKSAVSILRRKIIPTLRSKRPRQSYQPETLEREQQRNELQEIRLKILRQEVEINEERLKAAKLNIEVKVIQKEIEKNKLRQSLEK